MMWQEYIDYELVASQCVTKACIVGHDGNVLALSWDFLVTSEELTKLISGFAQQDLLASQGVIVGGRKYFYLSGTDRVVRARLGYSGVHCVKTNTAVIVTTYRHPVQPQQVASVVERLGDFLISCGY